MGLNFGVFFGESTTLNKQTNLSSGAERCWPQNFQHARQISAQRFKNGKMMSIGSEFGGIADEDKRALLITESPAALKQHLAMHAATLTTYEQVCAVVVSYLQAKRVWIPTATYAAGHTARARDPDAMNVDKIDDKKGKGKGKQEKGKKGEGKRKGDGKKNKKANTAKTQGKTKKGKSAQSAGETIPHKNAGTTRRAKGNKARMARLVKVGGTSNPSATKTCPQLPRQ